MIICVLLVDWSQGIVGWSISVTIPAKYKAKPPRQHLVDFCCRLKKEDGLDCWLRGAGGCLYCDKQKQSQQFNESKCYHVCGTMCNDNRCCLFPEKGSHHCPPGPQVVLIRVDEKRWWGSILLCVFVCGCTFRVSSPPAHVR